MNIGSKIDATLPFLKPLTLLRPKHSAIIASNE